MSVRHSSGSNGNWSGLPVSSSCCSRSHLKSRNNKQNQASTKVCPAQMNQNKSGRYAAKWRTWLSLCCPSCVDAVAAKKSSDKAEDAAKTQYKWLRKTAHIRSTQEVNSGAGGGGGEIITSLSCKKIRWRHRRLGRKKLYCLARFTLQLRQTADENSP